VTDSTTFGDATPPKPAPKTKSSAKKGAKKGAEEASPTERTPDQIQSDIDEAQQRLADQVDQLSDRLQPQALAEDAVSGVKGMPIAIVAGSITTLIVLRKIFHR